MVWVRSVYNLIRPSGVWFHRRFDVYGFLIKVSWHFIFAAFQHMFIKLSSRMSVLKSFGTLKPGNHNIWLKTSLQQNYSVGRSLMKAGLFVTLSESYQTFVNGLARNYDGSAKREFTSSVGGIETDVCIWSSSFQLDQFCKVKGYHMRDTNGKNGRSLAKVTGPTRREA